MQYTVDKIDNGIATVTFADGSWAEVVLTANMTEQDFDDLVFQFAPKTGVAPAFIQVGQSRTAQAVQFESNDELNVSVDDVVQPQWLIDRQEAYGSISSQIEYITENGLEAWQTHVAEIKTMIPKE